MQDVGYTTIVLSIFSSVILNGALFFLLKTWITERLRQSIAHEYALQLETHRAELKKEYDVALERLRADHAQQAAIQTAAIGSFAESHKAAHERRLQAVEMAWNAFGIIRSSIPLTVYLLDGVAREEYCEFFSKASYPLPFESPSEETLLDFEKKTMPSARKVLNARPFVGETIYGLFMAYHTLVMVAIYKLIEGNEKRGTEPWFEGNSTRQMLTEMLTDQELQQLDEKRVGKFEWVQKTVERKIKEQTDHIVSGESSVTAGLDQARRIVEAVRALGTNYPSVPLPTSPDTR